MKCIKDKIDWLLKYCSEYIGHEYMYHERIGKEEGFQVDLGIEEYILENAIDKKIILLTGDAGDGKSRVLENLRLHYKETWKYINDFSELDINEQKQIIKKLILILNDEITDKYIIAANSGIFMNAILDFEADFYDKLEKSKKFLKINFQYRNLAYNQLKFQEIVQSFLSIDTFEPCLCNLQECCPFSYNINRMINSNVIKQFCLMYDVLYLEGYHVTFRDLLSSLAYAVTKGSDCNSIKDKSESQIKEYYYYNNIFTYTGHGNFILEKLEELDIAKKDFDEFDNQYYNINHDIKLLNMEKRRLFFEDPLRLFHNSEINKYLLLPKRYLKEFNDILEFLEPDGFINSMEDESNITRMLELGLNKISNPNKSSAQMVLFDSPSLVSRDVRMEYMQQNEMNMILCSIDFYKRKIMVEKNGLMNNYNQFYCVLYAEGVVNSEEGLSGLPTLKINYKLFEKILLASENQFNTDNINLVHDSQLKNFSKSVFEKASAGNSAKVAWLKGKNSETENFMLTFIQPNNYTKSKEMKVIISASGDE